jgi:methanogenic corrinoid protein MtbC1
LAGRQIGGLVELDEEALSELLREDERAGATAPGADALDEDAAGVVDEALEAVLALDSEALDRVLRRAALAFGARGFLNDVLGPLMRQIGDGWVEGRLRPAHEHLGSAVAMRVAGWLLDNHLASPGAPLVLTSTPAGELHGLGAVSAALVAASEGWRVRHLGPNLPWSDLVAAVESTGADVLALSLIKREPDSRLEGELRALGEALPAPSGLASWVVGGPATELYADVLDEAGAVRLTTFDEFRAYLARVVPA